MTTSSADYIAPSSSSSSEDVPHSGERFGLLTLGSLGVVFGDIGTSPLYALKTAANGVKDPLLVVGVVSLIVWALFIVVTAKYVLFLMRADNKGEGGILSLNALARKAIRKYAGVVFLLGAAGAALFSGDAIITPAISVLSAVEGLKQVSPGLAPFVLPVAIGILIALFLLQSRGTARVAAFFGPVMLLFFTIITVLGVVEIPYAPQIMSALSPLPGIAFLWKSGIVGFLVLGSVFLSVTGAEALYADMGHFGRRPIQAAWLLIALPALICNYLGQGALILKNPLAVEDPFYMLCPSWALSPLILLSTLATVIASQAVITGAFSLASQAIQLGLLPRLEIIHTSDSQEGQIFIPLVNRVLLIGVLVLTFTFKSSDSLANAYGIAVSGTMVMTTALSFFVVWKLWNWSLWRATLLIAFFIMIDGVFFVANLSKVLDGGYVPLFLGATTFVIMWTWASGSKILFEKTRRASLPMSDLIKMLEKTHPPRVPGTAVFLTNDISVAPSSFLHNLKHNKVLHERVIFLCVRNESCPRVPTDRRYEIQQLSPDVMTIILHFGYMEQPRVPHAMAGLRQLGIKFDIMTTSFFLGRRTLKVAKKSTLWRWQERLFIALSKHAAGAADFFHIPSDRVVELGAQTKI